MENKIQGPQAKTLYQEPEATQETCLPPVVEAILKDREAAKAEPALTASWLTQAEDGSDWDNNVPPRPAFTEEKVELLRRATLVFFERLNEKLRENDIPEFDLYDPDEDTTIDLHGEEVTVQWRVYDRCGDSEYFSKSMSLSELVDKEAA